MSSTVPDDRTYIWVTNWEDHQTYSLKRGKPWAPPWIKLYPALLDDPEFLALSAQSRSLLVGIWALFARTRGTLTKDTRNLSRQLSQRVTEQQLERLNDAGFILFCSGTVREQFWNTFWNCSNLEVEVEVEVDKNPLTPADAGDKKPSRDQGTNPRAKTKHSKIYRAAESFVRNAGVQYTDTSYAEEMKRFDLTQHERDLLNELRTQLRTHNGAQLVPFNLILDTEPEETE